MQRIFVGLALSSLALIATTNVVHATPYASGVTKSGTSVSFILNEPADTLTYSINGGPLQSLDGSTKGTKTFNLNAPTDTFSIVAEKNAATGYTIPTGGTTNASTLGVSRTSNAAGVNIISDDTSKYVRYNSPRGVGVSKDPNAPNFGSVYISNSAAGPLAASGVFVARTLGDGLYALRSDGSDALGFDDTAQNPLSTVDFLPLFSTNSSNSPYRVTVGGDGQVYVADYADVNSNAWVAAPDLSSGRNLLVGVDGKTVSATNVAGPDGTALPVGQNHGSITAVVVEGAAATNNLVIYTIDEDMNSAHVSGVNTDPQNDRYSAWKYTLGDAAAPSSTMPTKVAGGPGYLIGDVPTGGITADLDRGADGKFYMSQYRSAGLQPGLVVTDASGTKVWDSLTASKQLVPSQGAINAADYSRDGEVNAADYVIWRSNVQPLGVNEVNDGTTADPTGCTTGCVNFAGGIGNTNANDYTAWQTRFGTINDIMTNTFAIAVSPDQKWLAALMNISDVVVIPLVNGIPDLANRMVVDTLPNVNSGRDIAFDAAGNIHYVSSGQSLYRVLSPGGHTISTITWNGTAYSFNVATSGSGLGSGTVPEPGTLVTGLFGLLLGCAVRRRS